MRQAHTPMKTITLGMVGGKGNWHAASAMHEAGPPREMALKGLGQAWPRAVRAMVARLR